MEVNYDYGVDISSNWNFGDGDLRLVEFEDNLKQSIKNRLGTELDSLDIFYEDYGSVLFDLLGLKNDTSTLNFVKIEVDNCLSRDPRINSFESEVSYIGDGVIRLNVTILDGETDIDLNFILSQEEIEEEQ